jgi:hypothetical protein
VTRLRWSRPAALIVGLASTMGAVAWATPTAGPPPVFAPFQAYAVGSWPEAVGIGDMTGDGRNDVLMTTSPYNDPENDAKLFLFVQHSDGSLGAPVRFPTAGGNDMGLDVGDLNGDGRPDVAVASARGVQVYLQRPRGERGSIPVPLPGSEGARQVKIADFNGDGRADLAVLGHLDLSVLLNTGDGFVATVLAELPGRSGGSIDVGDFDGDGRSELVSLAASLINGPQEWFEMYSQTSPGTFKVRRIGAWRDGLDGVELADVTGDGRTDLIASDFSGQQVVVFAQRADGELAQGRGYATGFHVQTAQAADLNADDRTDVAVLGDGPVTVFTQRADGTLGAGLPNPGPTQSWPNRQGLALGDVSGDGLVDVVYAHFPDGLIVQRQERPAPPAGAPNAGPSASPEAPPPPQPGQASGPVTSARPPQLRVLTLTRRWVRVSTAAPASVRVLVRMVGGRRVRSLVVKVKGGVSRAAFLSPRSLAPGLYRVTLQLAADRSVSVTKRMRVR